MKQHKCAPYQNFIPNAQLAKLQTETKGGGYFENVPLRNKTTTNILFKSIIHPINKM